MKLRRNKVGVVPQDDDGGHYASLTGSTRKRGRRNRRKSDTKADVDEEMQYLSAVQCIIAFATWFGKRLKKANNSVGLPCFFRYKAKDSSSDQTCDYEPNEKKNGRWYRKQKRRNYGEKYVKDNINKEAVRSTLAKIFSSLKKKKKMNDNMKGAENRDKKHGRSLRAMMEIITSCFPKSDKLYKMKNKTMNGACDSGGGGTTCLPRTPSPVKMKNKTMNDACDSGVGGTTCSPRTPSPPKSTDSGKLVSAADDGPGDDRDGHKKSDGDEKLSVGSKNSERNEDENAAYDDDFFDSFDDSISADFSDFVTDVIDIAQGNINPKIESGNSSDASSIAKNINDFVAEAIGSAKENINKEEEEKRKREEFLQSMRLAMELREIAGEMAFNAICGAIVQLEHEKDENVGDDNVMNILSGYTASVEKNRTEKMCRGIAQSVVLDTMDIIRRKEEEKREITSILQKYKKKVPEPISLLPSTSEMIPVAKTVQPFVAAIRIEPEFSGTFAEFSAPFPTSNINLRKTRKRAVFTPQMQVITREEEEELLRKATGKCPPSKDRERQ
uniref:uncharacterized protein LOC120331799 isoform X1 n=1 Tax=Styela clava TaxID=7725 RepID=UPI00193A1213|nr:uncharacterized protein LOC120331799 isoform X1 [Styela clava]